MLRECETLTRQMVPIKVKHRGRGRVGWRVRRRLRRSPSSSWLEPLTVYRVPNVAPCWHLSHDGRFALLSKHLVSAPLPSTPKKVRPNNLTDRRDNCLGISVSRAEILLFDDIDISHRISKQQYNIQKRNKEDEAAADLLSCPFADEDRRRTPSPLCRFKPTNIFVSRICLISFPPLPKGSVALNPYYRPISTTGPPKVN